MSSTPYVSASFVIDIEAQNHNNLGNNILPIAVPINVEQRHQQASDDVAIERQTNLEQVLLQMREMERERNRQIENNDKFGICEKLMIILLLVIIYFPFIICDMYYAYNDDSCVNEHPPGLNINMKNYLLGCSYLSIVTLLITFTFLCIASKNNIEFVNACIFINLAWILMIINGFVLVWHILGAVIFWGTLYPKNLCDSSVSTYLFTSLIIKLIFCTTLFKSNKKN